MGVLYEERRKKWNVSFGGFCVVYHKMSRRGLSSRRGRKSHVVVDAATGERTPHPDKSDDDIVVAPRVCRAPKWSDMPCAPVAGTYAGSVCDAYYYHGGGCTAAYFPPSAAPCYDARYAPYGVYGPPYGAPPQYYCGGGYHQHTLYGPPHGWYGAPPPPPCGGRRCA